MKNYTSGCSGCAVGTYLLFSVAVMFSAPALGAVLLFIALVVMVITSARKNNEDESHPDDAETGSSDSPII